MSNKQLPSTPDLNSTLHYGKHTKPSSTSKITCNSNDNCSMPTFSTDKTPTTLTMKQTDETIQSSPLHTPPSLSRHISILSILPNLNTFGGSVMDKTHPVRVCNNPTPNSVSQPILPQLFDSLSFLPASSDSSVVQFDVRSGALTAATPPRLVTAITSAESLDYDLMGDFFLTYRLFLSPFILLKLLEARLIWAFSRKDDTGKIVRIRTFVALRHWILNYFADDFVPNISLRNLFAKFLNELAKEECIAYSIRDQRIVSELKRCWVRACDTYWETPSRASFDITPDVRVYAGGPLPKRKDSFKTYSQIFSTSLLRRSKAKSDDWTENKYCSPKKTYSRVSPFSSPKPCHRVSSAVENIRSYTIPSPATSPLRRSKSLVRGGGKAPTRLFGWTASNFESTPKKTNGMRKMYLTVKKRLKAIHGEELARPAMNCVGGLPLTQSSSGGKGFRIDLLGAGITEFWNAPPNSSVVDVPIINLPENFMDPEILKILQESTLDSESTPDSSCKENISIVPIASSYPEDVSDSSVGSNIPQRNLRRKPGGDLKIAHTVSDLLPERPRSASTFSTCTHGSIISPQFGTFSQTPSIDACEPPTPVASLSLGVTLEAGLLALTDIPSDDDSDCGGVSTALLKLEGKYHRKSKAGSKVVIQDFETENILNTPLDREDVTDDFPKKHRHHQVVKVVCGEREVQALVIPEILEESKQNPDKVEQPLMPSDDLQLRPVSCAETVNVHPETKFPLRNIAVHLPFILAYDSLLLARQFTLIERDALTEVDWQELANMSWIGTANLVVRDWMSIVNNPQITGITLVIARFNLMCSWVASEIVLTPKLEERIKVVEKFIHLAAHSYRLSNFATFIQIILALQSPHVARLDQTWRGISSADIKVLRELETIASPLRNWRNLRMNMEIDDPIQKECIPFIGIYLSDLIFNAQRPDWVPSSMPQEMLVNFDRHRTTAGIIKKVLGMVERSRGYPFEPIEEPFQRCLWLAALDEVGIQQCSNLIK